VAIVVGLALIGVGLAVALLPKEQPFVGDNGREVQLPAFVVIPAGARACQPETSIPAGAGTIRLSTSTAGQPVGPLAITVAKGGRTVASGTTPRGFDDGGVRARLGSAVGGLRDAKVCVTNQGPRRVAVAGQEVPFGTSAHVSDPREPQTRAMRIEWFEPNAATRLSRAGVVAKRYALEKPSWVGTWTFWAALVVLIAASAAGITLVVREVRAA
jgi:hypothetical protein